MINATTVFSNTEIQKMTHLADVNEQLKKLEALKKTLSDSVKQSMCRLNVDECILNGVTFKITDSSRKTVTKATKDEFISNLVAKGKKHLLITSIEPDVDSIFAEVDAGTLEKDFVDKYIKVTPVTSLRVN